MRSGRRGRGQGGVRGIHQLRQTETAATNSWLFSSLCGHRFAADAGTRRTCNIEPRCMMACPGNAQLKPCAGLFGSSYRKLY
jgi:hypothetical protein